MKTAGFVALAGLTTLGLWSCAEAPVDPKDAFFEALTGLCGQKYQASVVESIESDQLWRESRIIMHVRDCGENEIRIPLSVGEDTSRTWIIRREEGDLSLKHDHRHEDGTADEVTMYGGLAGRAFVLEDGKIVAEFPADPYSIELFKAEGLKASVDNIWVLMINPGEVFSYRLQRPGRVFQIDFDLSRPVGE